MQKLFITNARISFAPGLFTAGAFEPGQKEKFGADFILTDETKVFAVGEDGKRTPTTIKKAELAAAAEGWKVSGPKVLAALEASKKSVRDGDLRVNKEGGVYDGYAGNWYVTAKTATRPTTLGANKAPVSEADGVIYSGCYVNVSLELYANTDAKRKGVFAGLKGVQFARDGDSFGGGAPASADEFDDVSDGADADDIV